jgi:UDP-N-acetylmuramoylalanine--D-glutamate ligase
MTSRSMVAGRRCLVMGLGAFGGGLGVTRWLAAHGADEILVTDTAQAGRLQASVDALDPLVKAGRVRLRLGEHRVEDFRQAELVVANPAVKHPWSNDFLAAARAAGATVTTEIRLALEGLPRDRVIGVTGSAGKSTTSAMIAHLLDGRGRRSHLAGNIGGSLLEQPPALGDRDWLVVELSSFMLWWLGPDSGQAHWTPRVAVLTNLADNHLDWHGDAAHYSGSKSVIRGHADQVFLSGFDLQDPPAAARFAALEGGAWWRTGGEAWTHPAMARAALACPLPGPHNRANALLALRTSEAALRLDGQAADPSELAARLGSFHGLPHRLCLVYQADGVRWFDDSKATTPEATLLALGCFDDPGRLHLIVGGSDKGADLTGLAGLASRLAGLYCIGSTAPALAARGGHLSGTLTHAVRTIRQAIRPGDVVLLSPGCASHDQFGDYRERGNVFAELARGR